MKKTNIQLLFFMAFVVLLSACKKDTEVVLTDVTTTDTENVAAIMDEIGFFFEGNDLAQEAKGGRKGICYQVTDSKTENEIVIEFESGCVSDDGKTRTGKMTYSWTGLDGQSGFSSTIVYENFSVDNHTIDGTFTIKDMSLNLKDTSMSFTMVVENAKFTYPDGKFSNLNETLTVTTEFAGHLTQEGNVDTKITGEVSGTTKEGNTYVALITKELLIKATCEEGPVSGTFVFTINQDAPMRLDYGDGTCDAMATLTRGAFSKVIDFSKD